MRQVLAGDADAFGSLMRRYAGRVQAVVARHVPPDRQEEVVQDTFVRAYRSLANFEPESDFPAWLSTLAVRSCYDFWRTAYRRHEVSESELEPAHREWAGRVLDTGSREAFETETARREAREVLDRVLATLSPEDRLVIVLVHLEGLDVREAAAQLGWSPVNVKVRAHRARRRLRAALEPLIAAAGGPL